MLPISRVQVGRDWMEIFTVLVWATVFLLMFLSKLKATQDILVGIILVTIMAIVNADSLFAKFRIYKVYVVLRKSIRQDCVAAFTSALGCLIFHAFMPDSRAPGIVLHFSALPLWVMYGLQSSPLVSAALYLAGRNQMTKMQLVVRVLAQVAGLVLAFALFGLYYSFRFPGEGPFRHVLSVEGALSGAATFGAVVAHLKMKEGKVA
eukprot:TRINITY_DN111096_c0_g1_i1.p1 TRINITY_DN111096_c0_g1~~TRINITY_DN111096_c0_g1_i1.p1  ORF type:complete len:206 (+),score=49.46 TRINITY_DN111096_c0_g1_i1:92-709(+)